MGLRVQPSAKPIIAASGTTEKTQSASNYPLHNPIAIDAMIAQRSNVMIWGTGGANDNLLSTNPGANAASGATTSTWLQDDHDSKSYLVAQFKAVAGESDILVIVATAPSTKLNESTYRDQVWAAQAAQVTALAAGDARIIFVPLTDMLPPSDFSGDTGSSYVHLDQRGAAFIANKVKAAIDSRIEAKTLDQISDMIDAGTYPLMSGGNQDTDGILTGAGGTLTGPGVTGSLATSKVILNTTGSTGVAVSQVATTG